MKSYLFPGTSRHLFRTALLGVGVAALAVIAVSLATRDSAGPGTAAADTSAAPLTAPSSAAFVKFEGVEGEAVDAGHEKWIDVLSISHGISRPGGGATGATRQRASATFGDVVVVKEVDKSTPKLQESIADGRVFPEVELELVGISGGARPEPYLKYTLTNVIVTNYRVSGSSEGSERPTESFSLNYEEVKVTYTETDSDGRSKGRVEYSWKVEEGTK